MPRRIYTLSGTVAASSAKILVQVRAGVSNAFEVIRATVVAVNATSSDQARVQLVRLTASATVTPVSPRRLNSNDATCSSPGATNGNGINASTSGTEGDVLISEGFNVLAPWVWIPSCDEEKIILPPFGHLALKLDKATSGSLSYAAQVYFAEL